MEDLAEKMAATIVEDVDELEDEDDFELAREEFNASGKAPRY